MPPPQVLTRVRGCLPAVWSAVLGAGTGASLPASLGEDGGRFLVIQAPGTTTLHRCFGWLRFGLPDHQNTPGPLIRMVQDVRAELKELAVKELKQRARALGNSEEAIAALEDNEDIKEALEAAAEAAITVVGNLPASHETKEPDGRVFAGSFCGAVALYIWEPYGFTLAGAFHTLVYVFAFFALAEKKSDPKLKDKKVEDKKPRGDGPLAPLIGDALLVVGMVHFITWFATTLVELATVAVVAEAPLPHGA